MTEMIEQIVREIRAREDAVMEAVCWDAMRDGCTVHVYPAGQRMPSAYFDPARNRFYAYHFFGVALEPGPVEIRVHRGQH